MAAADVVVESYSPGTTDAARRRLRRGARRQSRASCTARSPRTGGPAQRATAPVTTRSVQARWGLQNEQPGLRPGPVFLHLPLPSFGAALARVGRHQRGAVHARSHRTRPVGRDVAGPGCARLPDADLEAGRDAHARAHRPVALQGLSPDPVLRSARRQVVPPDAPGDLGVALRHLGRDPESLPRHRVDDRRLRSTRARSSPRCAPSSSNATATSGSRSCRRTTSRASRSAPPRTGSITSAGRAQRRVARRRRAGRRRGQAVRSRVPARAPRPRGAVAAARASASTPLRCSRRSPTSPPSRQRAVGADDGASLAHPLDGNPRARLRHRARRPVRPDGAERSRRRRHQDRPDQRESRYRSRRDLRRVPTRQAIHRHRPEVGRRSTTGARSHRVRRRRCTTTCAPASPNASGSDTNRPRR